MEIRKAFSTDAYAIITLKDQVLKEAYCDILPNGLLNELKIRQNERIEHLKDQIIENNRIFVALDDTKIIGYVFYATAKSSVYTSSGEIRDIYVLEEYQKKGIGRELFQSAIEELKKLNLNSVILYVPNPCNCFFEKVGCFSKEKVNKRVHNYKIDCDLYYYDINKKSVTIDDRSDWNLVYSTGQKYLYLLNNVNLELAIIMTNSRKIYLGLGIKNKVCPIEVALSNMYMAQDDNISKILILNKNSKPVLPCGKCRDLLISLKQDNASILFDMGNLKTITMKELNPYYKDEEVI